MTEFTVPLIRPSIPLLSILALAACGEAFPSDAERHPMPDRVVRSGDPVLSLTLDPRQQSSGRMSALSAEIASASPLWRIGALNGPDEIVFGEIADVVIGPRGRLMVLDSYAREVRIFGSEGKLVQVVGRGGPGPGEFSHPRALDVDTDGSLYVFGGLGRVTVFQADGDSMRLSRTMNLNKGIFDGCILADRMYVHGRGADDSRILHSYTLTGEPLHSFGEVYRTDNRILQGQISRGKIACLKETGMILLAPAVIHDVRAYGPGGDLLWWIDLQDLLPLDIAATPTGGTVMRTPEGGYHVAATLVSRRDEDLVLFQVALITRTNDPERERSARLHTFLLSTNPPDGYYAGSDLAAVVHWSPRALIVETENPFPQLLALNIGSEGTQAGGKR